ncbi:MAG: hypothetical protein ACK53L_33330, partial [Pirellulaceae bacterium]
PQPWRASAKPVHISFGIAVASRLTDVCMGWQSLPPVGHDVPGQIFQALRPQVMPAGAVEVCSLFVLRLASCCGIPF